LRHARELYPVVSTHRQPRRSELPLARPCRRRCTVETKWTSIRTASFPLSAALALLLGCSDAKPPDPAGPPARQAASYRPAPPRHWAGSFHNEGLDVLRAALAAHPVKPITPESGCLLISRTLASFAAAHPRTAPQAQSLLQLMRALPCPHGQGTKNAPDADPTTSTATATETDEPISPSAWAYVAEIESAAMLATSYGELEYAIGAILDQALADLWGEALADDLELVAATASAALGSYGYWTAGGLEQYARDMGYEAVPLGWLGNLRDAALRVVGADISGAVMGAIAAAYAGPAAGVTIGQAAAVGALANSAGQATTEVWNAVTGSQ